MLGFFKKKEKESIFDPSKLIVNDKVVTDTNTINDLYKQETKKGIEVLKSYVKSIMDNGMTLIDNPSPKKEWIEKNLPPNLVNSKDFIYFNVLNGFEVMITDSIDSSKIKRLYFVRKIICRNMIKDKIVPWVCSRPALFMGEESKPMFSSGDKKPLYNNIEHSGIEVVLDNNDLGGRTGRAYPLDLLMKTELEKKNILSIRALSIDNDMKRIKDKPIIRVEGEYVFKNKYLSDSFNLNFGRRRSNFGKRKVTNSRISLKSINSLIKLVQKI